MITFYETDEAAAVGKYPAMACLFTTWDMKF